MLQVVSDGSNCTCENRRTDLFTTLSSFERQQARQEWGRNLDGDPGQWRHHQVRDHGLLDYVANPAGSRWTMAYDTGRLSSILGPFGRRTTFSYDSGKIRTIQDPADVGRKQGCLTCATATVSSLALIAVSE